MYTIKGIKFDSFEEVMDWAWNEYKIMYEPVEDRVMTDGQKQDACKELEEYLAEVEP